MKIIKTLLRTEIEINTEDIRMLDNLATFGGRTKTDACAYLVNCLIRIFNSVCKK